MSEVCQQWGVSLTAVNHTAQPPAGHSQTVITRQRNAATWKWWVRLYFLTYVEESASSFLWNPSRCPEYKINKVGKVIREHWSIFQEFRVVTEGQSCFTKERQPCVYSYRWLPGTQQVNWMARRRYGISRCIFEYNFIDALTRSGWSLSFWRIFGLAVV